MHKKLLFTYILFNALFCISQNNAFKYVPENKDSVISFVNSIYKKKITKLESVAEKRSEFKKMMSERKDDFIKSINDSSYIFDKNISNYVKSVLVEIYKSNPQIDTHDFYFLISKSPIPNAASYGNGIFVINQGLFNFIDTDDEFASVLSHEISHFVLDHSDKSLLNRLSTLNSKEVKSKIKAINKTEYGRRRAIADLTKTLSYNFLDRSRKDETQADSLGLIMLRKTHYNAMGSINSLRKLETIDSIIFNEDSKIKSHFNFENYPFKESWLMKDETLFDIKEKANDYAWDKDSIKTHPDIPLRIELLKKIIQDTTAISKSSPALDRVKKIAAENSITMYIDNSNLDFALYQTLILFNKNLIDEKTYCNNICKLLRKTYEIKSNHTFGKYVGQISPFSDEKYLNDIKIFLNNIEIKNVRKIGYAFCEKYKAQMQQDPEFSSFQAFFEKLNTP
ncbi:M48 family metallopeptidase [Flavobacterium sp.]|uniref:M48 family metallopeptidase n=1 Tax=Flavobacterium sp. TaxID=239 RepID=UPI00286D22F6|nr:M48 family metallopeptidase [Flavobacterium sp.]